MQFGDRVGFPHTQAYSKYIPLDRDVFLYSLSASRKDKFEDYRWNWMFVGKLPYKGFINQNKALAEEALLRDDGYDVYLGESSAMSTLGILPDPIITTMISNNNPTVLINTIYHERTHQLFYKKNETIFNENAAVLLGQLTTLEYLKQKLGENSSEYETQTQRIQDTLIFSEFIDLFYGELGELYASNLSSEEKIQKREEIFASNLKKFKTLKLQKFFKKFDQEEINNAYIMSEYRYYGKIHLYYQVYEKLGDLSKTIQFFNETAHFEGNPEKNIDQFIT